MVLTEGQQRELDARRNEMQNFTDSNLVTVMRNAILTFNAASSLARLHGIEVNPIAEPHGYIWASIKREL